MAIKIPADVSVVRKKFADASARRKREAASGGKPPITNDPAKRKAGQEAADAKKKMQEANRKANELLRNDAEKDLRLKELEEAIATAQAKITELEAPAKRWSDFDHKRKERLIAKFPKEEQAKVRKFDSEALEALCDARGFTGEATAAGGGTKAVGSK